MSDEELIQELSILFSKEIEEDNQRYTDTIYDIVVKNKNIIDELEKDMRERYHKEIDYQVKIRQIDLMQGDYPAKYYYAEQNELLLNYYLSKLKELKEGK